MPSDAPIPYTILLDNFIKLKNHVEYTCAEDVKRWIKSEHLKIEKPIPLELTTCRWANRLYTQVVLLTKTNQ